MGWCGVEWLGSELVAQAPAWSHGLLVVAYGLNQCL